MTLGFQVAQNASMNIGKGMQEGRDARIMDEILTRAGQEGGQEGVQDTITQMLSQASPEARNTIVSTLKQITEQKQAAQEKDWFSQQGIDPNAPQWAQKEQYSNYVNKTMSDSEKQYHNKRAGDLAEYVNEIQQKTQLAQDLTLDIEEAEQAIHSGNVQGPGFKAALKTNPYTQIIAGLTPEEAALEASNKKFLEGTKGIFGSKPTEREIFLLLRSMLPSIGKTKEANVTALGFIKRMNNLNLTRGEIVNQLTDGGTKFVPNLQNAVNKLMEPYAKELKQDLQNEKKRLDENNNRKKSETKAPPGTKIYKAPDGSLYHMTEQGVADAAKDGVKFELAN